MPNNKTNRFGLTERDMQTIQAILNKFAEVKEVHIFGSRAKGNFKHGSDIDLAVMNTGVNDLTINKMQGCFEESSLPYKVDLINFPTLNHSEFIDHINRVGVLFYRNEGYK